MGRLLKMMNEYVTVNGMAGKARLSEATNCNMRSVERWISGQVVPSTQKKYRIAVVCGATHQEAIDIANEPSEKTNAGH